MASHRHWKFGASTMQRIVESETPMLSPFEIFTDCTQAHLDANRGCSQSRLASRWACVQSVKISNGDSIGVSDSTMRCIVEAPNFQCRCEAIVQPSVCRAAGSLTPNHRAAHAAGIAGASHLA